MSSIYEQLGGPLAVDELVDRLDEQLLLDPRLADSFAGVDLVRLARHQRGLITALLGGENAYAGRDLGQAHAHLDLEDEDFDAFLRHLDHALAAMGVSAELAERVRSRFATLRGDVLGT